VRQVIAAEDDLAAQVTTEDVLLAGRLEVGIPELLRHIGERAGVVGSRTRLLQRVLVEVGRVDLHPLPELVVP